MTDSPLIVQGDTTLLFLYESTGPGRGSMRRVTTDMPRMLSGVEWPDSEGLGPRSEQASLTIDLTADCTRPRSENFQHPRRPNR